MGERDWKPATVDALADLLMWWARREVVRLKNVTAANDGATEPPSAPASESSTDPVRPGVPSQPRCP